jgi:S-DNA-T family DNA segregation ATPase FtsK/SpoIIIE
VSLKAGEKIAPIIQASEDMARELGVSTVAVENDPDRPYYIRFLLPRADREFPTIPSSRPVVNADHYLPLWLGAQVDGTPYQSHVSEWPHLLVAGTTGSGKTTFLRSLLVQIARDTDAKVVVVDGKGEFDYVDFLPPTSFVTEFPEVLLGHERIVDVLDWLVNQEISRRRAVLRDYFRATPTVPKAPRQAYYAATARGATFPIAPVAVFVDEFAELMLSAGSSARSFEDLVQRVVQAGRSALVHLVLATQRPDANVLRGAIKANLPSRVALALPSHHDSMTVLNAPGAEQLLGKGDLLYQSSTVDRVRLQGFMPPL